MLGFETNALHCGISVYTIGALHLGLPGKDDFTMTGYNDRQTEVDLSNLHKEITEKLQVSMFPFYSTVKYFCQPLALTFIFTKHALVSMYSLHSSNIVGPRGICWLKFNYSLTYLP